MAFCKDLTPRLKTKRADHPRGHHGVCGPQFSLVFKSPPASTLLKKEAAGEGSGVPNRDKVGKVTREQVRKIAEIKKADLNASDEAAAMRMIEGTARNMGIEVVD